MRYQNINMVRITSISLTILFLGLMSASITHAENYTFVKAWGSYGYGNGQFSHPFCDAIDSSGNIYVTDGYGNRIEKFDCNGKYLTQWILLYKYAPANGVAVDSSNNVYVAKNGYILKYDKNGNFITKWGSAGTGNGQFSNPFFVAVDSLDNVYVTDEFNNRVQKFDSNGNFIIKWGSRGTGDGQFVDPHGIAVDSSGKVYVVDNENDRIEKFDSNGNFITKWGSAGIGNGQFYDPYGVAVDSSGNVYVTDFNNNRVQKFDSNGNFITKWGSYGSGNGQFNAPIGVAVNSSGNVYVVDFKNYRIQEFAPTKPVLPIANFTCNVTKGYAPLSVQFTDLSKNPTSRKWNFGDGTNSTLQNPVHAYSKTGNYTVNLTVTNANGTNSKLAIITVLAKPVLPVANFTSNVSTGYVPLTVKFTYLSKNATSWKWNFGDGTNSSLQSPTHIYSKVGNFTVNLTVKNANGTSSKLSKITVKSKPVLPVANFSANVTSGYVPLTVKFIDLSKNATRWSWNFGDQTSSTLQSPIHRYSTRGNFTVKLTVTNTAGNNTMTKTNYIRVK